MTLSRVASFPSYWLLLACCHCKLDLLERCLPFPAHASDSCLSTRQYDLSCIVCWWCVVPRLPNVITRSVSVSLPVQQVCAVHQSYASGYLTSQFPYQKCSSLMLYSFISLSTHPAFLLFIILSGNSALFLATVAWPLHISVFIVGCFIPLLALYFLLRTAFSDAGVLPRQNIPPPARAQKQRNSVNGNNHGSSDALSASHVTVDMPTSVPPVVTVNGQQIELKYCKTCRLYKPVRCKHCRYCDNCVLDFVSIHSAVKHSCA